MANAHDDPPEFIGTTQEKIADPKGKRTVAPPATKSVISAGVTEAIADPGTPVAVYTKPAAGAAHPKIARLACAERLDAAEAALNMANAELTSARAALHGAEIAEADAEAALVKVLPGPTSDEVYREKLARENAARVARVEAGLSPTEARKPSHGNSPLDRMASQRPRTSAQLPTGSPLRSNVVRRGV